jgi:hypothetical protein
MLPALLGALAGTYVSAGIILLASLLVGRAVLLALGRRHASFLEGAVGFATLILVCSIAIRLPGNEATSVVACAILVVASTVFLLVRTESILGPAVGIAIPIAVLSGIAASFPFIASGHIGIPGVGLNNDMAMHLVDVDYLVDPSRPQPQSIINGYPLGPHSLVGTVVSALGTQPLYGWLGLLVAVPVLTGITALGALRELPGGRRLLATVLVAVAYLSASVLGIAGFKELIAGMFLIAFALGLREVERNPEGRIAILIGLALITAAIIPVYSFPGVGWLAITAGLWVVARLLRIRSEKGPDGMRAAVRDSLSIVIPAAIVVVLVGLTQLPKVIDFINSGSVGNVIDTPSKLRYVISPLETLGVWPSGSWLLGTHDVTHYWLFGAIGVAGLIVGLVWWMGKRDYAVPAAVVSGILVYLFTKYPEQGGLYVLAKAVVVPASVVMLLVLTALLTPGGGWAKRIFAVVFVALAGYSSFLALRDTVVAPHNRLQELSSFQSTVAGKKVLALTSDRFTDYGLRTAQVWSPAYNSELRTPSAVTKNQRLPIDFDSVPFNGVNGLNTFPYAVTTSAIYQSQAPPGWTLVQSTPSYRLWKRTGTTPPIANLFEEARPGRVLRCNRPKLAPFQRAGGQALTWQPRTVIAKRLYWKAAHAGGALNEGGVAADKRAPIDNNLAPGETASQQIVLPPGKWELSLQYVSPVTGVTVRAPGLDVHLPAGVDAAIPYRPDQGPYWPVGTITGSGGPVTVSVTADDVNWFQSLIGVDAPAVIGNLTAVNPDGFKEVPTASACGLFVDHLIGVSQPTRNGSGSSTSRSKAAKPKGKAPSSAK